MLQFHDFFSLRCDFLQQKFTDMGRFFARLWHFMINIFQFWDIFSLLWLLEQTLSCLWFFVRRLWLLWQVVTVLWLFLTVLWRFITKIYNFMLNFLIKFFWKSYLKVLFYVLALVKYEPMRASSYLPLPKELKAKKKSCLNIQNNDKKFFLVAHPSVITPSTAWNSSK